MENRYFIESINAILLSYGFKKQRGNWWISGGEQVQEVIYLQKSLYSNLYYFIYGFNIKNLGNKPPKMNGVFDVICLSGISIDEWKDLQRMCDLETVIDDSLRIYRIKELLEKLLKDIHGIIDTEAKARDHLILTKQPLTKELIDYFHIPQNN